jgi:hypothetical protein
MTHVALAVLPATRALVRPCIAAALGPTAIAAALLAVAGFLPQSPAVRAGTVVVSFLAAILATGIVGRADVVLLRSLARPGSPPTA